MPRGIRLGDVCAYGCRKRFGGIRAFEIHRDGERCRSAKELRRLGLRRRDDGTWVQVDRTRFPVQRSLLTGRPQKVRRADNAEGTALPPTDAPRHPQRFPRPFQDHPRLPGLALVAILVLVLAGVAFPTASVGSDNAAHHRRCVDIPWRRGPAEIRAVIRCKVVQIDHRHPGSIPGGVGKSEDVADCESSDDPEARTSEYGGVYQIGATSDRHGEWRDWEPHLFWRYHRKADPRAHGRFNGFFNIARALGHVAWIVRHPRVGPWYGRGWGPWSCA